MCVTGVCHRGVPQGCTTGVCHRGGVSQGCVTGVCHMGCATGVCHRCVSQGCVTGVHHRGVPQGWGVTGVCHRGVPRVCHRGVSQGCATGVCHRGCVAWGVPQGCVTGEIYLRHAHRRRRPVPPGARRAPESQRRLSHASSRSQAPGGARSNSLHIRPSRGPSSAAGCSLRIDVAELYRVRAASLSLSAG